MALPLTITGIDTLTQVGAGSVKITAGSYSIKVVESGSVNSGGIAYIHGPGGANVARGWKFTNRASSTTISDVQVGFSTSVGSPTGNVYAEITTTDPTGTVITTSDQVACSTVSDQTVTFPFSSPPTISASATFGVVLRRTVGDASNYLMMRGTSGATASYMYNGTSWTSSGQSSFPVSVREAVTAASDAYFFFGRDSTTSNLLKALKATDPTSSWSSAGTVAVTNTITRVYAYVVGPIVHIATYHDNGSDLASLRYVTFNMATETFGSVETVQTGFDSRASTIALMHHASIVVRSDGTVVIGYNGTRASVMGSSYARVVYARRSIAGSWTTNVAVDAGGEANHQAVELVLGASDNTHIIWFDDTVGNSGTQQRTLNSSNVLQTASTRLGGAGGRPRQAIRYDDSGTIRIVVGAGFDSIKAIYFSSANTPTLTGSDLEAGASEWEPVRAFVDGTDVYMLWRLHTDSDLYVSKSTDDGATWGTKVSAYTGTIAAGDGELSVDGSIYLRGSNYVIPYVFRESSTLKYNEYIVRSTGVTGTMAAPETADDATFAGDVVLAGVTGELVVAETADDATLTGSVAWLGTLAAPETADDATITASVAWNAILAAPETADDATFAGAVAWNAVLDADETADDATITGGIYGTGELDADETADDATITATVAWTAILAATETADDATLAGTVEWLPATGTMAAPETADDATFAGSVAWTTVLNAFETADDATLAGTIAWIATLAANETADDATIDGAVAWLATLAATEAADDATFDGQVIAETITGELAVTEAADDATFDGEVTLTPATGELDADEAADDATMAGSVAWLATLAATEAADDATLDGSVAWLATLAATETADDATISGSVAWLATLAVGETADDATFAGSVAWLATLAANETADDATFAGSVAWLATLAALEAADDATFDGGIYGTGTLVVSEAADDATFDGGIYGTGTLVVSEAADDATFAGEIVGEGVTGAMAASEIADDATMSGDVTGYVGALAAIETADDATIAGTTGWSGTLAANETADAAAISGSVAWAGILAATEAADDATFDAGIVSWVAILSASEAQDSAAFAGETAAVPAQVVFTAVETPDGAAFLGKVPERVILPFVTPRDYGWYERKHVKKLYRKG